ncbi:CPSF A subunit region-domain-containing protein [Scenedesmus sp. NREL 46B-D3]|nr:CPSF A subunit region-domain-containing protein [Scenedesmus sp. NREL 46B-D3]
MRRGLVADIITAVPSLQAHGAWTLHYRPVSKQQQHQADAEAAVGGAPSSAEGAQPDPEGAAQAVREGPEGGQAGPEGPEGAQAGPADLSEQHHAFVLLSCGGQNTMVLDAGGAELSELSDDVAYVRDAPTLAVGEIFDATAAVQVTHTTVRMVRGSSELLQELLLTSILQDASHPAAAAAAAGQQQVCIRYAQVRDPYVVLLLSDATTLLLCGDKQRQQLQLLPGALADLAEAGWGDPLAAVTAACLYTDTTGWLAAAAGITADQQDAEQGAADAAAEAAAAAGKGQQQQLVAEEAAAAAADDEDALMAEAAAAAPGAEDAAAAPAEAAPRGGSPGQQEQQDADTLGDAASAAAAAPAGSPVKAEEAAAAGDAAHNLKAEDAEAGTKSGGTIVVPTEAQESVAAMDGVEGVDTAMALAAAMEDAGDAAAAADDKDGAAAEAAAEAAAAASDAAADVGVPPGLAAGTAEQRAAAAADVEVSAAAAAEGQQQQRRTTAPEASNGVDGGKEAALAQQQQQPKREQQRTAAMMTFCVIVRAGGALQVYALPGMMCVFEDAEAVLGHQTLSPARPPSPFTDEDEDAMHDEDLSPSPISELLMECFAGSSGGAVGVPAAAAPLLVMLRDDGSCLAYKAFKPHAANSPLGFRRLPLDAGLLPHPSPAQAPAEAAAATNSQLAPPAPGMPQPTAPPCRLVRFDQLATPRLEAPLGPGFAPTRGNAAAGSSSDSSSSQALPLPQLRYSGVFVCGPRPAWLVASRGGLLAHPMEADVGQVDAFCAFHNLNCVHGYMAASLAGALNICTLPLQMRLDQPWLTSKLPLRATPQALAYYPEARLLALTTSRVSAPPRPFLPLEPGGDAVAAAAYATAEAAVKAAGVEDLHELLLLAPPGCGLPTATYTTAYTSILAAAAAAGGSGSGLPSAGSSGAAPTAGAAAAGSARAAAALAAAAGWAGLPMWRYPLLPGEAVTALRHVSLCEGGDENSNPEPFLAVGCSSAYGEDFPAMGRVLLFQVLKEKIYRVEGSSEVISGRLELQREYPGPVTALESLRGFLLMAIGNKLEMHYKQGNTLVKVTFFDGLQMVSGLALVKDFLLLGQAGHSAAFFRYNCTPDPVTRERQQQLKELSADTERLNAWAVEFMPNAARLSQVMADGGGNLTVFMYDMKNPDSWAGKKLLRRGVAHVGACISQFQRLRLAVPGDNLNRQALLGCSAQGSLLLLCPLWDEGMFKRLQSLQEELVYQLRHTAGLNPKAFQGRYTRAGPTYGAGFTAVKPLKPLDNWLLQGDLLWSYAGLDLRAQAVIAEAVGVEPAMLLQDLRTLSIAANFL